MKLSLRGARILDFDIENRPLTYLGSDFTTAEVTAIAASFGLNEPIECWLLGRHTMEYMLYEFVEMYNEADIVTGHYIRAHDLPIINGALLECGMKPLSPKLVSDTKLDLIHIKGISQSQESISGVLNTTQEKVHMTQADWRSANRLINLEATRRRVVSDVRQHQEMRLKLTELGMLTGPRMWMP